MRWLRICTLITVVMLGTMVYPQTSPPPAGITRAALEQRLVELQKGRDQAMANVNAFDGAIQECQHWLSEFDKAAKSKQPAKDGK